MPGNLAEEPVSVCPIAAMFALRPFGKHRPSQGLRRIDTAGLQVCAAKRKPCSEQGCSSLCRCIVPGGLFKQRHGLPETIRQGISSAYGRKHIGREERNVSKLDKFVAVFE